MYIIETLTVVRRTIADWKKSHNSNLAERRSTTGKSLNPDFDKQQSSESTDRSRDMAYHPPRWFRHVCRSPKRLNADRRHALLSSSRTAMETSGFQGDSSSGVSRQESTARRPNPGRCTGELTSDLGKPLWIRTGRENGARHRSSECRGSSSKLKRARGFVELTAIITVARNERMPFLRRVEFVA